MKTNMKLQQIRNIIKESYLQEVGDLKNIEPYEYTNESSNYYKFETAIGEAEVVFEIFHSEEWDGVRVYHNKFNYANKIYNVVYAIENVTSQIEKTNYRELIKILATVTKIIEEFIKKESPYALLLVGDDKRGTGNSDKQKNTLYLAIATSNLPSGYRVSDVVVISGPVEYEGKVVFRD